jgi:hypothetical protein
MINHKMGGKNYIMEKEKKLQVFISSTYKDLINERQAAVEAVLNAGHIPAGMELFKAGDQTQKELIREWIEESDVYLLILGARYGTVDPESNISYTEWEYNLARKLRIPSFSLILTEDYINQKVRNEDLKAENIEMNNREFKKFKANVESHMVEYIDHKQAIKGAVLGSLNNISKRTSGLKGWIRYDDKLDQEKFYELVKENQELKKKLQHSKVAFQDQTKNLIQGDDSIEIKINFKIFNKINKINKKGNEYTRFEYSKDDFLMVKISINELTSILLPKLIQYGNQGLIQGNVRDLLYNFIISKAGIKFAATRNYIEKKEYFNDNKSYRANFKIPELNKIITQLKLLNLVTFKQIINEDSYNNPVKVYVCITETGIEEFQRLFAYKRDNLLD